jgi:signal transduction histidine kinase
VILPGSAVVRPELLRQIAGAAATLVEVVRLRLELARALREVESSRARLVQAGYEERKKLERDLHDGAQQRLVSLGMAFRLAQRHLDDGSVDVNGLLDQGVAELGTALAELRKIAYGLRPGRLDDGLDAALTELVRTVPITVDLDVCTDRLPDDVATTAYYVVSEAITNVVKHATADRIGLRVIRSDGRLLVSVSDDGRGGATLSTRSSIADRVAALGGTLLVHSPLGSGTTVEAVLPCAS